MSICSFASLGAFQPLAGRGSAVREFEDSDAQEPVRICTRSYDADREHDIVGSTDGIWWARSADTSGAGPKRRGRYVGGRCFGRGRRRDSSASGCRSGTGAWSASWRAPGDVSVHGYAGRWRHRRRRCNRVRDNLLRQLDQHDDVDDGDPQVVSAAVARCNGRNMPGLLPERLGPFEFSPGLGQLLSRLVLPRQIPFVKGARGRRPCRGMRGRHLLHKT